MGLSLRSFFVFCLVFVGLGVGFAHAWTGPTQAPPNGNVSAPVNVGTTNQVKNASLSVNGLAVFGNSLLSGTSRYLTSVPSLVQLATAFATMRA